MEITVQGGAVKCKFCNPVTIYDKPATFYSYPNLFFYTKYIIHMKSIYKLFLCNRFIFVVKDYSISHLDIVDSYINFKYYKQIPSDNNYLSLLDLVE